MAAYNVSTSANAAANVDGVYPRSRVSQSQDSTIIRSRTWSEDITKNWNEASCSSLETVAERVNRYMVYFSLTQEQLTVLVNKFRADLEKAIVAGADRLSENGSNNNYSSLRCLDTYIPDRLLPRGSEEGSAYAIDFSGPEVVTAKVVLQGDKHIELQSVKTCSLRDVPGISLPLGLMDGQATASQLFDTICNTVLQTVRGPVNDSEVIIGCSVGFPCEQRGCDSATLLNWTKGFQTGRSTNDEVEGMDIAALLNCAFFRRSKEFRIKSITNDAVANLVASCYELPRDRPAPRMSMIIGGGVNAAYLQPDAESLGYVGSIFNCEIGNFDKSLPLNDVDLEVDFADEAGRGHQLFEKMTATTYLGELCRRLIVKVWQNEAPPLAWVRYSMPWLACVAIIDDQDDEMTLTDNILRRLWEWETTDSERRTVQKLFDCVFDRAAALCAVALVAVAHRTERLQPAMGGLTCALGGTLPLRMPSFIGRISRNLKVILKDTAGLVNLEVVERGSLKGAGIIALSD